MTLSICFHNVQWVSMFHDYFSYHLTRVEYRIDTYYDLDYCKVNMIMIQLNLNSTCKRVYQLEVWFMELVKLVMTQLS